MHISNLKYPKEMYTDCGLYDGDMDSEEISCYKEKLVKCRKPHKCNCCRKDILVGDYALSESGFTDGHAMSCYTCTDCIESWLEESGQVDTEDDEEESE